MISRDITEYEDLYDSEIDQRIANGQIHPRLIRWYNEDQRNDEPINSSKELKERYASCKVCDSFIDLVKVCKECNCFMPIKTQLKKSKCPKGKWQ
jgi:hypothetical protein